MKQFLNMGSVLLLLLVFVIAVSQPAVAQSSDKPATPQANQTQETQQPEVSDQTAALHDKLAKYLSGTKWTGQFTVEGKDNPSTEHYEILSAEKNEVGDYWNLVARIKYGDHDKTLPLPPIEIKFADKTPVITIDRVTFPGFGTFDARVLIRQGKYAGTWAHSGGKGGHLFGTIERMEAEEVEQKTDKLKEKTDSPSP